jgi:transposase InsO family protein
MARRKRRRRTASGSEAGKKVYVVYPVELRLRVVKEVIEGGHTYYEVAKVFGLGAQTVKNWVLRYRADGIDGLVPFASGRKPAQKTLEGDPRREAVIAAKQAAPQSGTRKLRDVLARFEGLGVAESTVRRVLHEEGLIEGTTPEQERGQKPPRRFERAAPNQMWQSDLFTFLLRRHERLYLVGFMDDHSRYIVGHALAHHQRAELVLEAIERALARYGTPEEVLTDQGRQYTAWRGETSFEQLLRRNGIRHVKSRPQHPQTLGKIERFWKTLWDEFLSRTVFADYADCERRLAHFIDHYNFHRPHQGLAGLVPADRFFRAAQQVREAVEQTVESNALRMAREQAPHKPFYLVGRLGDRDLSISATEGGVRVRVGEEQPETIRITKEHDDDRKEPERLRAPWKGDETQALARPAEPARGDGPRRDHQAPLPDAARRAERPRAGDGRDRRSEDLARDVLPARSEGAAGDDARGLAGDEQWWRSDDDPRQRGRSARAEGGQARDGETTTRASARTCDEDRQERPADDRSRTPTEAALDEIWGARFAGLGDDDAEAEARPPFEPEAFRGRAMKWDRKLAGADAISVGMSHGEAQAELRAGAEGGPRDTTATARGPAADDGTALGNRGRRTLADLALVLPDASQSRAASDGGRADTGLARTSADRPEAARDEGENRGTGGGERAPAGASGLERAADQRADADAAGGVCDDSHAQADESEDEKEWWRK